MWYQSHPRWVAWDHELYWAIFYTPGGRLQKLVSDDPTACRGTRPNSRGLEDGSAAGILHSAYRFFSGGHCHLRHERVSTDPWCGLANDANAHAETTVGHPQQEGSLASNPQHVERLASAWMFLEVHAKYTSLAFEPRPEAQQHLGEARYRDGRAPLDGPWRCSMGTDGRTCRLCDILCADWELVTYIWIWTFRFLHLQKNITQTESPPDRFCASHWNSWGAWRGVRRHTTMVWLTSDWIDCVRGQGVRSLTRWGVERRDWWTWGSGVRWMLSIEWRVI